MSRRPPDVKKVHQWLSEARALEGRGDGSAAAYLMEVLSEDIRQECCDTTRRRNEAGKAVFRRLQQDAAQKAASKSAEERACPNRDVGVPEAWAFVRASGLRVPTPAEKQEKQKGTKESPFHSLLYHDSVRDRETRAQMRSEAQATLITQELAECTFKPVINPSTVSVLKEAAQRRAASSSHRSRASSSGSPSAEEPATSDSSSDRQRQPRARPVTEFLSEMEQRTQKQRARLQKMRSDVHFARGKEEPFAPTRRSRVLNRTTPAGDAGALTTHNPGASVLCDPSASPCGDEPLSSLCLVSQLISDEACAAASGSAADGQSEGLWGTAVDSTPSAACSVACGPSDAAPGNRAPVCGTTCSCSATRLLKDPVAPSAGTPPRSVGRRPPSGATSAARQSETMRRLVEDGAKRTARRADASARADEAARQAAVPCMMAPRSTALAGERRERLINAAALRNVATPIAQVAATRLSADDKDPRDLDGSPVSVFDCLYAEASEWRCAVERLRVQAADSAMADCTFAPDLSKSSRSHDRSRSVSTVQSGHEIPEEDRRT